MFLVWIIEMTLLTLPLLQEGSLEIQMGMNVEALVPTTFCANTNHYCSLLIALKIFSVIKEVAGGPRLVVDFRKTDLAPMAEQGNFILPAFEGRFSTFRAALSSYYLVRRGGHTLGDQPFEIQL